MTLTQDDFSNRIQAIENTDDPAYSELLSEMQALDKSDAFSLVRQYRRDYPDSDATFIKQLMKDVISGNSDDSDENENPAPAAIDTDNPLDQEQFSAWIQYLDSLKTRRQREAAYEQFLEQIYQLPNVDELYDFARYHMQNHPNNQGLVKKFVGDFDADKQEAATLKGRVKNIVKNARHHALRKPGKYMPAERIESDRMEVIDKAREDAVTAAMAARVYRTLYSESIDPGLEAAMQDVELSDDEKAMLQTILNEFGIVPRSSGSMTQAEFALKVKSISAIDDPVERDTTYQSLLRAARTVPRDDLYMMAREYMQQPDSNKEIVKQLIQELDSEDAGIAHLRQRVYNFVQKLHQNKLRKPDQYARHQEIAEDRAKIISDALKDPVVGAMTARIYRDTYRNGKLYSKRLKQAIEDTDLTSEQEALVQEMIASFA